jgi:hypothetical protein
LLTIYIPRGEIAMIEIEEDEHSKILFGMLKKYYEDAKEALLR